MDVLEAQDGSVVGGYCLSLASNPLSRTPPCDRRACVCNEIEGHDWIA